MPSLIRFLVACAVLAALVYGGLFALANFVKVKPREITQTIQLPKAGTNERAGKSSRGRVSRRAGLGARRQRQYAARPTAAISPTTRVISSPRGRTR